MSKFINLRTYSDYSLQLGISKISDYFKKAKELGHEGVAIADKMSLAGMVEIAKARVKHGLTGIIGMEINITKSKNIQDKSNAYNRATVFIKNAQGYKNLCMLLAESGHDKYFYYRPRIDLDLLAKFSEGLVMSTGDIDSLVGYEFAQKSGQDEEMFLKLKAMFGEDLYAEISLYDNSQVWDHHNRCFVYNGNTQIDFNRRILELANKHGVRTYVSAPAYMADKKLHTVQTCMILNSQGNNGWHLPEPMYLRSVDDIKALKDQYMPEISSSELHNLMANTMHVSDKCKEFEVEFRLHLPNIDYKNNHLITNPDAVAAYDNFKAFCKANDKPFSELFEVCEGEEDFKLLMLSCIYNNKIDVIKDEVARARLLKELLVTQRNGIHKFSDYFNPLEDMTNGIREMNEMRGFARGSGGGSIINYLMDITDLDPIKYDLIYERFNSRQRVGEFFFKVEEE